MRSPNYIETSHSHEDVLKVMGTKTLEQELKEEWLPGSNVTEGLIEMQSLEKFLSQIGVLRNQVAR